MADAARPADKAEVVAGPAVIHTGSSELFGQLVRNGYVNLLYAGNALATHDIEQAFYGTSLGVSLEQGRVCEGGHEHHLRTINRIRRAGGIVPAVASGLLTPCSLWYSPHALHTGSPSAFRRQSVVVVVPQLVQHSPSRRVALCLKCRKKMKNQICAPISCSVVIHS